MSDDKYFDSEEAFKKSGDHYFDSEKAFVDSLENPSRRSFFGKLGAIVAGAVAADKIGKVVEPKVVEAAKVELKEDYPTISFEQSPEWSTFTFAATMTTPMQDAPYTTMPGLIRDYRWEDSDALRQGGEVRLPEKYGRLKRR